MASHPDLDLAVLRKALSILSRGHHMPPAEYAAFAQLVATVEGLAVGGAAGSSAAGGAAEAAGRAAAGSGGAAAWAGVARRFCAGRPPAARLGGASAAEAASLSSELSTTA